MTSPKIELTQLDIGYLDTGWHDPHSGRTCVHAFTPPPDMFVVKTIGVSRLNFQPRVITEGAPCIAARRGSVLEISFDEIGPFDMRHTLRVIGKYQRDHRLQHRWSYQLYHAIGYDDRMVAIRIQQ